MKRDLPYESIILFMKQTLSQLIVDAIWHQLATSPPVFMTPDKAKGKPFTITDVSEDRVSVKHGKVQHISKESFRRTIEYLIANNCVSVPTACDIRASKSGGGPLDIASRVPQNNKADMVIPYVLPILAHLGIVSIKPTRRNAAWLNL